MERPLIEVCVDSMESAREAVRGGADRLELCANLIIGGTTPSPALIREAAKLGVPVNVLIRPRFGDFLFTQDEKQEQLEQIAQLRALGASGAVVGALRADGSLDTEFLAACRAAAVDGRACRARPSRGSWTGTCGSGRPRTARSRASTTGSGAGCSNGVAGS